MIKSFPNGILAKDIQEPGPIPATYRAVAWRNTTPLDPAKQEIGIGLELPCGQVIRHRLTAADAKTMAISLLAYLDAPIRSHSSMSSGMPSAPGLIPEDGQKVLPPLKSSTADCADE